VFALARAFWLVLRTLWYGVDVPGYASLATAILLLGGIQLIGIGVLGEYIGRIYLESKGRPVYLVRRRYERTSSHG
jgi:glycosyltransferase involved in cell wall biosynthesis